MDWTEVGSGVWLFGAAVHSLVVAGTGQEALIVDTGLDESHARKLLAAMRQRGLTPSAILNTHSHADHHGGNRFVLKTYPDLPIYALPLEAAIINHPVLEPLYLYGAHPPKELRGKFVLAPSSPAQTVQAGQQMLGDVPVELLEVPGHASQMYAVRVGGLLYAADALFGLETLARHLISFCVDSAAMKRSAAALAGLDGVTLTAMGHGEPTHDLAGLVAANLAAFGRVTDILRGELAGLAGPRSLDDLLAAVSRRLGAQATTAAGVLLNRSALAAHLAELLDAGEVISLVEDNRLLYSPAP